MYFVSLHETLPTDENDVTCICQADDDEWRQHGTDADNDDGIVT